MHPCPSWDAARAILLFFVGICMVATRTHATPTSLPSLAPTMVPSDAPSNVANFDANLQCYHRFTAGNELVDASPNGRHAFATSGTMLYRNVTATGRDANVQGLLVDDTDPLTWICQLCFGYSASTQSITLSFWLYIPAGVTRTLDDYILTEASGSATSGLAVGFTTAGYIRARLGDVVQTGFASGLVQGEWSYFTIVFTYTSTTSSSATYYRNGASLGGPTASTVTASSAATRYSWYVGADGVGTTTGLLYRGPTGTVLDGVRVYSLAMDAGQVGWLYYLAASETVGTTPTAVPTLAPTAAPAGVANVDSSLLCYYTFSDGHELDDSSDNGRAVQVITGPLTYLNQSATGSPVDQALRMDATEPTTTYARLCGFYSASSASVTLTFSIFMSSTTTVANYIFSEASGSVTTGLAVGFTAAADPVIRARVGSATQTGFTSGATAGAWHHIAVVFAYNSPTSTTVSYYRNGALLGTEGPTTVTSGSAQTRYGWYVGASSETATGTGWRGPGTTVVDNVRLYSVALTADQVAWLYHLDEQDVIGTTPSGATSAADQPSAAPTAAPTAAPSAAPTALPSATPTAQPSALPSAAPTTATPSAQPSAAPSAEPTALPSATPTATPSAQPTAVPSARPTSVPTGAPTHRPTASPTPRPTAPRYNVNVSVYYDWRGEFENLALRLAPDGFAQGPVPDALARMHLAMPPGPLDGPDVRLATLQPISRADLFDPNADCRYPYTLFTQPLLGYHFVPQVDLTGAAILARINLSGLVYYRPSRRLYHCVANVPPYVNPQWVSVTDYCAVAGLPQYANVMSPDGLSLSTVFCHATPFMIAEDPTEAAVCIRGRYGCDCLLEGQYDTSATFMALLAVASLAAALGVTLRMGGLAHERARGADLVVANPRLDAARASTAPTAAVVAARHRRDLPGGGGDDGGDGDNMHAAAGDIIVCEWRINGMPTALMRARLMCRALVDARLAPRLGVAIAAVAFEAYAVIAVRAGGSDTRAGISWPVASAGAVICYAVGAIVQLLATVATLGDPLPGDAAAKTRARCARAAWRALAAAAVCVGNGLLLLPTPSDLDSALLGTFAAYAFLWLPAVQWVFDTAATLEWVKYWVCWVFLVASIGFQAFLLALVPCGRAYIGESL